MLCLSSAGPHSARIHHPLLQLGARTALLLPVARAIHPASEARPRASPASSHACTPLLPVCHPVPHSSSHLRPVLRAQVASSSAPDYAILPSSASGAPLTGGWPLCATDGAPRRVRAVLPALGPPSAGRS